MHLMKSLCKSQNLHHLATKMVQRKTSQEVGAVGVSIFCILYGGKDNDSLNSIRYRRYQSMVAHCNKIEPERLPPTERAAYYHSLRVHLQIVQWLELDSKYLDECQWGWTVEKDTMHPIMTDLDAAPQNVLKFIRCKCKAGSKNQCGSKLCSRQKHGLKCVLACVGCHGETCCNMEFLCKN